MREQDRPATAEEQVILARWSGWGAVPQLFDSDRYAGERLQLRALLNDIEYAAARRSTINTHYTDATLVSVIWEGLRQLGFTGGDVLEPGCGSGHFIGLAPDGARMVGVEREPISAGIAAALYPQARVVTGSFADLDVADATFDASVGNVPFAKVTLHDPRHNAGGHSLHNHFIIKALHLTRPGGTVAVLTSRYTMDAVDPAARAEMAELADLVGAIRLPNGAHRRAAGTDAITDLLILRRREPGASPQVDFTTTWESSIPTATGGTGRTLAINRYFADHPERVLGELVVGRGLYGEDLEVAGDLATLPAAFASAVQAITTDAIRRGLDHAPQPPDTWAVEVSLIDPNAAAFAGFLRAHDDGTFTRRVLNTDQPYMPPANQAPELRALLGLRDVVMALITAEQQSADDTSEIQDLRRVLNTRYDAYVADHGPVNRYTERRQLRQGWHVFADWCDRNHRSKLPADAGTVRDYLTDLQHRGLGRDRLQRFAGAIVKTHDTAHQRQLAKAIAKQADDQDEHAELAARQLAATDPSQLLRETGFDDLRLPESALAAAHDALAAAPATTHPDLDLDVLGLRTTIVLRPPQGGFRDDPFANVVRALEKFDPTTQTARKADIFISRVINPPRTRNRASNPEEALSICLDTHSRVDLDEIARLLDLAGPQPARAALGELVYDDPATGQPIWAREYLAGNVRHKLVQARQAAQSSSALAVNVAALERVVPTDLGPEDIEIRLGSWIGATYVQQFLRELLDDPSAKVEHVAGMWQVTGQRHTLAATELWGGGGLDALALTERLLVGNEIRVMRTIDVTGPDGIPAEREVFDVEATEQAKDKAREIGDRFADWVWEDTTRAKELIKIYNDTFNAEIPPDYAGVELTLPGLSSAFTLREHQKTAIARIIYQPATGLIHDVGAGKTLEMIVGVMERRRRGLAAKPAVIVPNDSIAEQFEREWLQAYPSARLLTGTSADLAADKTGRDKRTEFVARIATGDWDAVIMTKESFQRIPLHPEAQEWFLGTELNDLRQAKTESQGELSQTMTKRLETAMESAEQRLTKRLDEIDRDTAGVTLRDSGIDFLVVDEAQNYKNGMVSSALPGLAIEGADRSIDLDMKLAWLAETHGGSRVVLATATPFTNTFSEIYLWLRRLGHHLPPFDTWARTYCTSETFMEMTPGGNLRPKSRMRRVINEPELWRSLRLTSDIKMKDDLKLPTPALRGGQVEIISVPASAEARTFTLDLARRERNVSGRAKKGADNHLVIQHHGQLAALDLRTVGVRTTQPQKVDVLADDIHTEWSAARDRVYQRDDGTDHPIPGGLILVFCDESTPGKSWNFYDELKHQLVVRGLPEQAIRFIHEATSPQRKADLLAACREGAVAVLVGSTMKMGAGLNVQTRAIGGYELTGPWRPDIPAQARGRVERQGNQNPEFFWKRVVTSPSMDAKKWEITTQKHGMFAPLYASTPPSRTRTVHDDQAVGLADVMAAATGDPRYREKAELDQEHQALTRQRSAHLRSQQALRLMVDKLTAHIPELEALAQRQTTVAARRVDTRGDAFRMSVGQRAYTKRADAANALKELLLTELAATPRTPVDRTVPVGSLGGYRVEATLRPLRDLSVHLGFPEAKECTPGFSLDHRGFPERYGLITRLENHLDAIASATTETRELIEDERRDLDRVRAGVGKEFPNHERLTAVTARRNELINELSVEPDAGPDLDPDSPEAKARAARDAARQQERRELAQAAMRVTSQLTGTADHAFATWYVEIAAPATPDQRPPAEIAYAVWTDLCQRALGDQPAVQPRDTSPRIDVEPPKPVSPSASADRMSVEPMPRPAATVHPQPVDICALAARWFESQFDASPEAQRYLQDRLGGREQLDRVRQHGFLIGHAPAGWTNLMNHLGASGYSDQDAIDAGLAITTARGNVADRFRQRIMFGIRDTDGRIAGFIGRALSDDEPAKYLNSPASPRFDKSTLLFGWHEQRDLADHADPIFVEGPIDVLVIAADLKRRLLPVASCGTAITAEHLHRVDQLIPVERRRVFAFDGDLAGQRAAQAQIQKILNRYPNIDINTLPSGHDPASWATTSEPDPHAAYLGPPHTRPALDVLIEARIQAWGDRLQWVEGSIGAARDVANLLATAHPDQVAPRAVRLATRLNTDPAHIAEYIAEARHRRGLPAEPAPIPGADTTGIDPAADTPHPDSSQAGPAGEEPASRLVIEHNHSGTLVRGSTADDRELHKLLRDHSFKYSRRLNAWYLGRQLRHDTRTLRVRQLSRAGPGRTGLRAVRAGNRARRRGRPRRGAGCRAVHDQPPDHGRGAAGLACLPCRQGVHGRQPDAQPTSRQTRRARRPRGRRGHREPSGGGERQGCPRPVRPLVPRRDGATRQPAHRTQTSSGPDGTPGRAGQPGRPARRPTDRNHRPRRTS